MSEIDTYLTELINSIFYRHSKEEYKQLENNSFFIYSRDIQIV